MGLAKRKHHANGLIEDKDMPRPVIHLKPSRRTRKMRSGGFSTGSTLMFEEKLRRAIAAEGKDVVVPKRHRPPMKDIRGLLGL